MAFLEQRLSQRIERGASGGPVNRGRQMVRSAGGRMRQVFTWPEPLHTYTVSHGVLGQSQLEELRSLWYVVNFTPYEGFRFRDWSDYRATQANSRLTLISGATYQLQRVYRFASVEFVRKIQKPVTGAVVYRLRSSVTTVATASVDTTTGIATITGHVAGDTYTWAGEFDVPVTFSDDAWLQQLEAMNTDGAVATMPAVNLEEIVL
jgi:uncharacterized protein (TIGR02217 family)